MDVRMMYGLSIACMCVDVFVKFSGFNPGGAKWGKYSPRISVTSPPPQAYDTITNPSPALPNVPHPPKILQLLFCPLKDIC